MGAYAITVEPTPCPSEGLVERAQGGDLAAYERLYHRHVARIYALTLRMTADPDRAEEATQQAFVNAWRGLGTFDGENFGAWLKRIAINAVLSEQRSRGRRREDAVEDVERVGPGRPVAVPDTGMDLETAIATLPERARAVFVLHDVEGYRHREIARTFGIAEGTSKAQLHRARKLLREVLQR